METAWFENDESKDYDIRDEHFDCYFETTPLSASEALSLATQSVMSCALNGRSIARALQALYEEHGIYFYLGVYGDHFMVSMNMPDGGVMFKKVHCDRNVLDAISWNLMFK